MSPVDLDGPSSINPHAVFAAFGGSLPKFTLAALDSPLAASTTRQSAGSVNGPEAAAVATTIVSQPTVVPIQEMVGQLLARPKLGVTNSQSVPDDKTPYQTLVQHLMGSGQAVAHSPGVQPDCLASAVHSPVPESTPGLFKPCAVPQMHPMVQATPARHRSACTPPASAALHNSSVVQQH